MWWMIGLGAVAGGIAILLLGRRDEVALRRDWQFLLSPGAENVYRAIEGRVSDELTLADVAYDQAFSVRELGSVEDAMQLLDAGYRVIERFTPDMLRLLSAMATFSRMVSAMAPVPPLRPSDFKLAQLASLAYLNRLLHQLVASAGERFRLRLYILGRSVGLASRFLLDTTRRVIERRDDAEREWQQIRAIREDFQTLTDESLASLRALLSALSNTGQEEVLQRLRLPPQDRPH